MGALELNLNSIKPIQITHKSTMEQRQEQDYGGSGFPAKPEEFDADERISFSKLDNKFVLVQEDGSEFEYDDAIKRWIPVVDEALLEEQQKAYRVSGVDEAEPVEAMKRKRKKEYVNGEDVCSILSSFSMLIYDRKVDEHPKPPRKLRHLPNREPTLPFTLLVSHMM